MAVVVVAEVVLEELPGDAVVVVVGSVVVAMVPTVGSGSPEAGWRPVGVGLGAGVRGAVVVAVGVGEVAGGRVVSPAE